MKTKYKFINFEKDETGWSIWNHKNGDYLGRIEYYKPLKKWEFCPDGYTGFTIQCLLDIVDFLKQLK